MKIETIIEGLVNHEITKADAIRLIRNITDGLRSKSSIEFNVEEVSFSVSANDGFLKLRLPYGYNKIEGKINKGDKVDVTLIN